MGVTGESKGPVWSVAFRVRLGGTSAVLHNAAGFGRGWAGRGSAGRLGLQKGFCSCCEAGGRVGWCGACARSS